MLKYWKDTFIVLSNHYELLLIHALSIAKATEIFNFYFICVKIIHKYGGINLSKSPPGNLTPMISTIIALYRSNVTSIWITHFLYIFF